MSSAEHLPDMLDVQDDMFHIDQYRTYQRLLRERPLAKIQFYDGRALWMLNRYEDVRTALRDPRFSNDPTKFQDLMDAATAGVPEEMTDVLEYFYRNMLRSDPPSHTRLRKLVSRAFTVRRITSLRPRVQELVTELLDDIEASQREHPEQPVDLMTTLAYPLPGAVICELLGVPSDAHGRFRQWSTDVVSTDPDVAHRKPDSYRRLMNLIIELIRQRRAEPGDDLLSALVKLQEDGDRLDDAELVSMVFLLLVAGVETTVNLIGNGSYLLLHHPEHARTLREQPDRIPTAIDEILRYLAPVELTSRCTLEPVRFGDTVIPTDSMVLINLSAANRDPEQFPNPDNFDPARGKSDHMTFGGGLHFCLGAALARTEGELTLAELLRRFPSMRLAIPEDDIDWRRTFLRGPVTLPVLPGQPVTG